MDDLDRHTGGSIAMVLLPQSGKMKARHWQIAVTLLFVIMASSVVAFLPTIAVFAVALVLLLAILLMSHASWQLNLLLGAALLAAIVVQWIPALASLRFALLACLLLLCAYRARAQRLPMNPVAVGLAVVALYALITSPQSYYPTISFLKGLSLLILAGVLLLLPPAITSLTPSPDVRDHILRIFLYLAIFLVVSNAIYYFIRPTSSIGYYTGTSFSDGRFRGWFVNPNGLATVVGVLFVPILWFEAWRQDNGLLRLGILAVFIMAVIELLLTQSRSGMLAAAISLGILLLGSKKWGTRTVVLAGLVLSLMLIYLQNPSSNIVRRFIYRNEVELQGSGRLPFWIAAWNRFLERPVLGSGLGVSETGANAEGLVFSTLGYYNQIDNSYLATLEQLGVVGSVLLVLTLLIPLGVRCWKLFGSADTSPQGFNLVYGAVVVAGLFSAIFESWLLSVGNMICLSFWIFAVGLMLGRPSRNVTLNR